MHYISHTNNVVYGDSEGIFLSAIFKKISTDEIVIFEA